MHIWYLKDYLGNNRVLTDGNGNALKVHHYGPFGEQIAIQAGGALPPFPAGSTESPYKYGGKEWNTTTSTYDFEARQMAPAFHRFTSMEPLCEKYYSISPYAYCANNPVNRLDPSGMIDKEWLKKGGVTLGIGVASTIGGVLAVMSEVGVYPGAYAISTGIPSIGLGLTMITYGLITDPSPEGREQLKEMPTGVLNAIGKEVDSSLENENHEAERVADFVDAVIGLGTLSKPRTASEAVLNLVTLTQAGIAADKVNELAKTPEQSPNNPQLSKKHIVISKSDDSTEIVDWQDSLNHNLLWTP